ncbi:hypothetical protein [Streptosporangium sp. NPDC051022]|uniref:hypothetical protein n=1 Tax=Streptosporangium sp. NPDC051022 TaxID=3155752 RepID=UPI0034215DEF
MMEERPSDSYTLADLDFLTLRAIADRRAEIIETLVGGGRLDPREIAELTLAKASDDADTLRALAASPYIDVRRKVAGNVATPADTLRALALADDDITVEQAARNPTLAAADLEFVNQVGSEWAQAWLLRHPDIPQHLVDQAAEDHSVAVRVGAALHPRSTAGALARLAVDPDSTVRAAVARHPYLPAVAFTLLAADDSMWVRAAVAENPVVPAECLARLAADEELWVRRAAAKAAA